MDVLKNKKHLFVIVLIFLSAVNLYAQSYGDLQKAFKESYLLEAKGQFNKAVESIMMVYNKDNYETNLRLGWLYYTNKQYTESMQYYQNCINIMPYSIEAKLGYVMPASATEDWAKVMEQYNSILAIDPMNTTVNYRMGLMYYYKPDYATAYKYFEKVVNLYPFDYSSMIMFAWTNLKMEKYREAEILFNKVLLIKSDDSSALDGLGANKK